MEKTNQTVSEAEKTKEEIEWLRKVKNNKTQVHLIIEGDNTIYETANIIIAQLQERNIKVVTEPIDYLISNDKYAVDNRELYIIAVKDIDSILTSSLGNNINFINDYYRFFRRIVDLNVYCIISNVYFTTKTIYNSFCNVSNTPVNENLFITENHCNSEFVKNICDNFFLAGCHNVVYVTDEFGEDMLKAKLTFSHKRDKPANTSNVIKNVPLDNKVKRYIVGWSYNIWYGTSPFNDLAPCIDRENTGIVDISKPHFEMIYSIKTNDSILNIHIVNEKYLKDVLENNDMFDSIFIDLSADYQYDETIKKYFESIVYHKIHHFLFKDEYNKLVKEAQGSYNDISFSANILKNMINLYCRTKTECDCNIKYISGDDTNEICRYRNVIMSRCFDVLAI